MTIELFLQAFLAPIIAAIIAAFTKRFYPLVLLVAFWAISLWVKGTTLEAMDSVAIALTLSVVLIFAVDRVKSIWLAGIQFILLSLLSVWQVKNFASSISVVHWLVQAAFLAVVVLYSWFVPVKPANEDPTSAWARLDTRLLFILIPGGYVAILSPMAGSILVGQMAGLVTLLALAVWVYQAWSFSDGRQLAVFVAAPALFVGLMAWHYVEIQWSSLALGMIGWLPLLWPGLRKLPWWLNIILAGVLFGALLGVGFALEWPEESLY